MANSKRLCKLHKEYITTFIKVPAGVFCTYKAASEWARAKVAEKAQRMRNKAIKAEKSKHIKQKKSFKRNDVSHQHKLTQPVFNRMRVLEEMEWFKSKGQEPECISCGKTKMDWCCGHLKTVGAQGGLRYDPKNTMLQCNRYCNMGLSGNINGNKTTRGYLQGVIDRYGSEEAQRRFDYLEDRSHKTVRYTGEQLVEIRKRFNAGIRELERGSN